MFSKSDVNQAEHEFRQMIEKTFGEVWSITEDGKYHGCAIDLKTMVPLDNALWELCQMAKHRGALRAAGKIEIRDMRETMRVIIFYKKEREDVKLN